MAGTDEEEVDFEVDAEDLDTTPVEASTSDRVSLLVNDLHVTYRVFGAKKVGHGPARPQTAMQKILARGAKQSAVREVKAITGISFSAVHGESIGIIGVNGSGKSTLLRAIAGLIPPAHGSVYVAGYPALLGVNAALMRNLTGEQNIMIGGLALGLTQQEVQERYDDIVDFAEIGEFVNLPMRSYSSGMGARLRFAISASAVPDILMIDEALSTGDAGFRAKSKARINEVREAAGTVFLVSHSLATVRSMCSRVLWVHRGKLVMDGPADEVCEQYKKFINAAKQTAPANKRTAPAAKAAGAANASADAAAAKNTAGDTAAPKNPAGPSASSTDTAETTSGTTQS